MKFPLFKRVALLADVPKYKLCRGDIATIVEHHPHPDEDGYSLEVFNAFTVRGQFIKKLPISTTPSSPN